MLYRDVEGSTYDRAIDSDALLAVWPQQAPGPPTLHQSGESFRGYNSDDWYLWIHNYAGFEREAAYRPIPGTILGKPHGFGLETASDGRWRAVAVGLSHTVEVEADGQPPERLDLLPIESAS